MKCKLVIALLWGFFLSLGTTFAQQVTNKIYIPVIECGRGKTVHIPFYLTNNTEIVALQFNLQLPSGCTLVSSSWNLTDRKTDHTVAIQKTGNNRYVVIVYSPTNAALRGNSGELLNFSLGIPETWEIGSEHSFAIEEPILSARNGDNVLTTFDSGALKVTADPRPDVAVSTVKVNQLTYAPGDKIAVSWLVKNEGDKETGDGWSEQILLVADNGESLYLGTVYYNSIVGAGGTTTRQAEFSLSDLLGIEGKAKVKVKLIPGVNLGELTTAYGNNVAHSENELTVTKKIKINLPTTALKENYNSLVRCQLYRSGSWMSEQMFTLRADKADRLKVPETVTIPSGQSGTAFYIQVIDNDILNTDSIVKILVEGNGYEALEGEIGIEDDELPELLLKTSKSELTEGEAFVLTITRKPVSEKPLTVYLACDHDRRFKYPQTAQIAAGDASVDLTITAIDDHAPDETISAEFAVSAFRHIGSKALVILNDNDVPEISLTLSPETINESAGPMAVMAVLKRLNNINSNVKIKLSDDSNGRLYYSSPLLSLDAGVKEATFTIGVIDNALVEEDKDINITAAVHLSSCSCSATETSGGIVHAKLKLLDDDGPALKISSSQTVLQEGKEQASLLTISRNTSTEHTLSVNLSSDHDAELIYKQAVTIPAGQSSVEVPVSVKSNEVSEGDRTVTFTAQTDGYAKGICWVMVTDQTLPDAVISQFGLSASEVETGGEIGVTINIANAGVAPLSSSLIVEFFLDNESRKLGSLYTQKQLAVGENETFSKKLTLPELTGEHTIYAIVNRDQLIKELFPLNNSSERKTVKMLPKYTVSAITNKQVYNQGETVLISGIAVGNQIANVPIEIYLINANIRQELSAVTDGQGKYQVNFRPYALQDGHFVVGACYPGEKLVAEQSAFDIYGLKQIASDYNKCEIAVGEAYDGEIRLLNPGILPLNTISVEVLSVPEGCTVSFSEIKVIPGDEKATLKYHIVGTTPTNGSSWEKIKARVATAEGVSLDLDIYYYCRSLVGQLKADILSIKTTMIKDASRDYSFIIKNEGKGETGKITLSLPQGEWMKAITPLEMSSLKSGESATVILRLTPTTDMALNVPVTGTIGLNCRNGNGFSLSYNCTPVSEATGKLVIDVCNEYTYYTPEAPHLAGAKVAIMNFITDAVIMQGVTDEHGLYTIESLPEGYYKLMVSADKHDVYTNNILIDPGKENRKTVNLSFQAISIQWEVEETTVEDEYNIVTTVKYETNVPVPVVEVIMPDSLPVQELVVRGAYLFNAVLTNKGLITAQDVHIDIPEVDGLSFELLVEQDFKLRPSESVVVPVRVTVKDKDIPTIRGAVRSKNSTDGWPCHIKTYTIAFWDCGNDRKWHQYEKPIRLIT